MIAKSPPMKKPALPAHPLVPSIKAIPFLKGTVDTATELLTERQRDALVRIGTRLRLPPRMVIYRENVPADWVFAVVDGAVKSYRDLPSGRRTIAAFLFARDLFGLAENGKYVATAQAITRVTLYRLPIDALTVSREGDARTARCAAPRDSDQPARCRGPDGDVYHDDAAGAAAHRADRS